MKNSYSDGKIIANNRYSQNKRLPVKIAPNTNISLIKDISIFKLLAIPQHTPNIILSVHFVNFFMFFFFKIVCN